MTNERETVGDAALEGSDSEAANEAEDKNAATADQTANDPQVITGAGGEGTKGADTEGDSA